MIGGVKEHMRQDVFHAVRPGFAFAVAVFDNVVQRTGRELVANARQISLPRRF
jgi:hypothetical protein